LPPTLVDLIDGLAEPELSVDAPFRMCVTDVFKSMTLGAATVAGKVLSGSGRHCECECSYDVLPIALK
jgi:translation elongation factor EF-1alpha